MRVGVRAQKVRVAQNQLAVQVYEFQEKHELTDVELLQALVSIEQSTLKYLLRNERHPDDPDKGADEE